MHGSSDSKGCPLGYFGSRGSLAKIGKGFSLIFPTHPSLYDRPSVKYPVMQFFCLRGSPSRTTRVPGSVEELPTILMQGDLHLRRREPVRGTSAQGRVYQSTSCRIQVY